MNELKDMATMIRRLASALRKADPISILPAEAIGFLKRTGHKPEPMRLGEAIRVAYEEEQEVADVPASHTTAKTQEQP